MRLQVFLAALSAVFLDANAVQCPNGSIPGFPHFHLAPCYLFETYPAQFVTAELHCRIAGGRLASVADLFSNDFIAQAGTEAFSILGTDKFWIGGNDLTVPNQWEWTDKSTWNFTYWEKGHPNANADNNCLAQRLTEGYWVNANCYEDLQYVCALPEGTGEVTRGPIQLTTTAVPQLPEATTPSIPAAKKCGAQWKYFADTDSCYLFLKESFDWNSNRLVCETLGAELASIHSEAENNFVTELSRKPTKIAIGLHSEEDKTKDDDHKGKGQWKWTDKSGVDFQQWSHHEPSKDHGCVAIKAEKKDKKKQEWHRIDCSDEKLSAVCRKPWSSKENENYDANVLANLYASH
jgi:hypothetical protein